MLTKQFIMSRFKAMEWLDELSGESPACTVHIAPKTGKAEIEKTLGSVLDRGNFVDELAENAFKSPTGAIISTFRGKHMWSGRHFPFVQQSVPAAMIRQIC